MIAASSSNSVCGEVGRVGPSMGHVQGGSPEIMSRPDRELARERSRAEKVECLYRGLKEKSFSVEILYFG